MQHSWPPGSRLGVRLRDGSAIAALVVDGVPTVQFDIRFTGSDERALTALLRTVRSNAPGPVDSVAWEFSELLNPVNYAERVAALRLLPRQPVSNALGTHPTALMRDLVGWRGMVHGGHDMFGLELAPPDIDGAVRAAHSATEAGYSALAITAAGAVGAAEHERAVAERVRDEIRGLRVCISHELGGLGILRRETATVLSAALQPRADELVACCERATAAALGHPTAWFAAADGGRVSAERLRAFPVVGLEAGAAAGILGSALLAGASAADVETYVLASLGGSEAPEPHRYTELFGPPADPLDGATDAVAIGCAATEPSARLDLVVSAETTAELNRVRSLIEHRACTVVASAGALPGSERVVSSSVVPLSFLRSGSYRVVVRAAGQLGGES